MALAGVQLETLVSETDALTTRPPRAALRLENFQKGKLQGIHGPLALSLTDAHATTAFCEIFTTCGT